MSFPTIPRVQRQRRGVTGGDRREAERCDLRRRGHDQGVVQVTDFAREYPDSLMGQQSADQLPMYGGRIRQRSAAQLPGASFDTELNGVTDLRSIFTTGELEASEKHLLRE